MSVGLSTEVSTNEKETARTKGAGSGSGRRGDGRGFGVTRGLPFAVVLLLLLLAIVLILNAERAPVGVTTRSGAYGWLLLQAAGTVGLALLWNRAKWSDAERIRARWAAGAMAFVFAVNAVAFALISTGFIGPNILAIAIDLIVLFFSGVIGAVAALASLAWTIADMPAGTSILPGGLAAIVVVAAISLSTGRGNVPPPSTPAPFTRLSGPVLAATASPTVTPTSTVTPSPSRTQQLVVNVVGNGSVTIRSESVATCQKSCTYSLREGIDVAFGAQPGSDSILAGWRGCNTPCRVRMDQKREITATFRFPTVEVSVEGKGRGAVRSEPSGITCQPTCEAPFGRGTRLTLMATAESASAFTGWSDACVGFGSCAIAINSDVHATAQFENLAGGGASASQACPPANITLRRGQTASLTFCFLNDGKIFWTRGTATEVQLATCCPLGGPSPLSAWNAAWLNDRVYADQGVASVAPGGTLIRGFNIRVPDNAAFRDYEIDGFLVQAGSGAPMPRGAFSIVVTVIP